MTTPKVETALKWLIAKCDRYPDHPYLTFIRDHIAALEADRDDLVLKNARLALANGQLRFDADMAQQSAAGWRDEIAALRRRVKSPDHLPDAGNMVQP